MKKFSRLPKHIGIIPDGNRRWAVEHNLSKEMGYDKGVEPGVALLEALMELGVEEVTFYGFTKDNTKRNVEQKQAFVKACIKSVERAKKIGANILVVGDNTKNIFPKECEIYLKRDVENKAIKANFLLNYDWQWDLKEIGEGNKIQNNIKSKDISKIDLIIRWGGRLRLSGFLPIQSVYADFYSIDDMWPDFEINHLYKALEYYEKTDVTLGG
ncbi:MAG: undecaprenyl diphosphate synthase family protein [Lachnospirales bacterium]